jgi:site-specific DNA-methyltransferase (adenine-specific)
MTHFSEGCKRLNIELATIESQGDISSLTDNFDDVVVFRLPSFKAGEENHRLKNIDQLFTQATATLGSRAVVVVLGEIVDLVAVHETLTQTLQYQQWIAIKRLSPRTSVEKKALPNHHFGATIYTRYTTSLKHTKTRTPYTYCPACDKTTKDYGGKKHTYHEYGTLISDVWRDTPCDLESDVEPVLDRLADLFGLEEYQTLLVVNLNQLNLGRKSINPNTPAIPPHVNGSQPKSQLIHGDCLENLKDIPDNSVDFVFVDPPYNLSKKYRGYSDDMEIAEYFQWCDEWISELARTLKPGRTLALLNIPLWSIRHFKHLETVLQFQNWIAWDALSYPVRLIMPAHYTILCFSKGEPRPLPGLTGQSGTTEPIFVPEPFRALRPLAEGFCLRSSCIKQRRQGRVDDRDTLTDLWWDIHRIKHNTRRVDHPTQLPPQLMYRLISTFTQPSEIVLDCFNGSGTTTLTAHQLDRRYVGIEKNETYYKLMVNRHNEVEHGIDPFRKEKRKLTAKNSPVDRLPEQKYEVPKKTLQLEVKRVAQLLDRLPTREEMIEHGTYPIRYYDDYFISWGEVCAAARTTGMTEDRVKSEDPPATFQPPLL